MNWPRFTAGLLAGLSLSALAALITGRFFRGR